MNGDVIVLILSSVGLILGLGLTYWIHSRHDMDIVVEPIRFSTLAPPLPMISVIIPARNEARNIRRCVEA